MPSTSADQNNSKNNSAPKHNEDERYQTPPVRPTTTTTALSRSKQSRDQNMSAAPNARRKISPNPPAVPPLVPPQEEVEELDDYAQFCASLGESSSSLMALTDLLLTTEDDDDVDFFPDKEEDDDDVSTLLLSELSPLPSPQENDGEASNEDPSLNFFSELEAELGSLVEEDLEAAVTTLLANSKKTVESSPTTTASPTKAAAAANLPEVTPAQRARLSKLLEKHAQLLLQNCVLSVRAAKLSPPEDSPQRFYAGETGEDLMEILDGAVGMLQDLDQNRKDAIRNYIQLLPPQGGKRSLLPQLQPGGRLTRSAFESLEKSTHAETIFNIAGLSSLKQTFGLIDVSTGATGQFDVLQPNTHQEACRLLLQQAGVKVDESYIPGVRDLSTLVCDPKEVMNKDNSTERSTLAQVVALRKNRNAFTAAEDNLVLRGVNLYGEKQWMLIADRYLPDRSVNIISQRYSKLCLMIYKAHGIQIDDEGNLETPPRVEKVEQLDEEQVKKLKRASPPAILNVHRWSLEEDLLLLKAVPLLGHMWAELSTRLMPHRDRGHLRKRYQVLERRVKATVTRAKREQSGDALKKKTAPAATAKKKKPKTQLIVGPAVPPPRMFCPKKTQPPVGNVRKGQAPRLPTTTAQATTASTTAAAAKVTTAIAPTAIAPTAIAPKPEVANRPAAPKNIAPQVANHPAAPKNIARPVARHPGAPREAERPVTSWLQRKPTADEHLAAESLIDSSRDASKFEKILNETSNDWSQLSRMKKMMENDTESMVADAIVTQLANGGRKPETSRLPQMELDSKSSSGLSMLNSTRDAPIPSTPGRPQNGSIMASVLERTARKDPPPVNEEQTDVNGTAPAVASVPAAAATPHDNSAMEAPPPVPLTPNASTYRLQRYPSFGTPLGVSPGPGMRSIFSPGVKNGQSPNVKSCFSPAAINSMMFAPNTTDEYQLYPFELSEESRQALEHSRQQAPTASPLTPSAMFTSTEGLKPTDLEAISALNSLSNSPAKFLRKRSSSEVAASESQAGGTSKSLFAAVVGGVEQKESKRRKK